MHEHDECRACRDDVGQGAPLRSKIKRMFGEVGAAIGSESENECDWGGSGRRGVGGGAIALISADIWMQGQGACEADREELRWEDMRSKIRWMEYTRIR